MRGLGLHGLISKARIERAARDTEGDQVGRVQARLDWAETFDSEQLRCVTAKRHVTGIIFMIFISQLSPYFTILLALYDLSVSTCH
jgi:hypothetical protein